VELREWKDNPTTEEIFERLKNDVEVIKESLLDRAGMEPLSDAMWAGVVKGIRQVLEIEPDEVEEA